MTLRASSGLNCLNKVYKLRIYQNNVKLSIITSMHNNNKLILDILDNLFFPSLLNNANKYYEFILVDDLSPKKRETELIIKKYEKQLKSKFGKFIFIKNKTNLGFAKSFNKAASKATGEVLILANDDLYFPKNSITDLYKQTKIKKYGLIGPSTNEKGAWTKQYLKSANDIKDFSKNEIKNIEKTYINTKKCFNNEIREADVLAGFCFSIRKEIFNEFGGFPEIYGRGYFEDTDLAKQINKKYRLGISPGIFIYHGGPDGASNSFKHTKDKFKLFKKNFKIFSKRNNGYIKTIIYLLKGFIYVNGLHKISKKYSRFLKKNV